MVRLGAADSTSGELSGLDEKPDQSRRCALRSMAAVDMSSVDGAGGEMATMGVPFLRKEESDEGEEASCALDLLMALVCAVCESIWEASMIVGAGVMFRGHGGRGEPDSDGRFYADSSDVIRATSGSVGGGSERQKQQRSWRIEME